MKKYHLKAAFAIRAALVAAAVAVHSAFADTPDELLDYVQTDGSAYIDTGIIGKTGTKASIGMMWHNGGGTKDVCFLGARNGSNGRFLLCHAYGGNWNLAYRSYYTSSAVVTNPKPADDTFYSVQSEIDATGVYKITVNGKSYTHNPNSSDTGSWSSSFSMYLFALQGQTSGTANNKSPSGTRCYWTRIWQQDANGVYQFVRDFVPCKKGDRVGLWDRVSGDIFYPATGTLTAGSTVAIHAEPDKMLEYVESDGTQYIDTGVVGRDGTKAAMTLIYTSLSGGNVGHVMLGSSSGVSTNMFYMPWCRTYNSYYRAMTGYNARYQYIYWAEGYSAIYTNTSYVLSCNVTTNCQYKATLNGHGTEYDYSANGPVDTGYPMYAFAANDSGVAAKYTSAKLYSMKIWQTDANGDYQLVRDFIPCIKDGKASLFDKVSNMVYFSRGTKEFSAEGARVLSARGAPDKFLKYVASTGAQYIDTGVVGRDGTKATMTLKWTQTPPTATACDWCFLGSYGGSKMFYLFRWLKTNGYNAGIYTGYNGRWGKHGYSPPTDRSYEVISEVTTDGTYKMSHSGHDQTWNYTANAPVNTGCHLYIFARDNAGTADNFMPVRCYGLKIEQTDSNGDYQTVRDYKPCLKDGRAGLYDEVSDTVYFSLSKTDLLAPPKGVMVIVE